MEARGQEVTIHQDDHDAFFDVFYDEDVHTTFHGPCNCLRFLDSGFLPHR